MEGICQQDTWSLVKDIKEMSLRGEMLRMYMENVLMVKSDFWLSLRDFWLILILIAALGEVTDLTGSGGKTPADLEETIKYYCFSSAPFFQR